MQLLRNKFFVAVHASFEPACSGRSDSMSRAFCAAMPMVMGEENENEWFLPRPDAVAIISADDCFTLM